MPLPPGVDQAYRKRFEELINEARIFAEESRKHDEARAKRNADAYRQLGTGRRPSGPPLAPIVDGHQRFTSLQTRLCTLLKSLSSIASDDPGRQAEAIARFSDTTYSLDHIVGALTGIYDDYKAGMLDKLVGRVEAEISADYLGQAEMLLKGQHKGVADRVPAAVLAGAVLENALRTLCQRQNPPVDLTTPNGGPKMMNSLIPDLKKAGVYDEPQAKQLLAWAGVRNAAAHGDFDKFDRNDVERMVTGINDFLVKYL